MSELKNCPFCGGSNIYVDGYDHDAGTRWRVVCLDCMATVDDGCIQQKYRAIEAWNRRADGWTPVTEGLPKHRERVLAYSEDGDTFIAWVNNTGGWEDYLSTSTPSRVTHWRARPEPPKRATAQEGATPCSD